MNYRYLLYGPVAADGDPCICEKIAIDMRVALLFLLFSLVFLAKMDHAHSTTSENTEKGVTKVSDNEWFQIPSPVKSLTEAVNSTINATLYYYMDDVITRIVERVRSTLEATLYQYMENMTSKFAEKVHEELYKVRDSMWKWIIEDLYPGEYSVLL